jgi:hypothetical protein
LDATNWRISSSYPYFAALAPAPHRLLLRLPAVADHVDLALVLQPVHETSRRESGLLRHSGGLVEHDHADVTVLDGRQAVALTPASAITNGRPDGEDHPYVGLIVSFDRQDNVKVCSGSLIASNVVLTAGHCVDGMDVSFVLFKKMVSVGNLDGAIPGERTRPPSGLPSPLR